MPPAYLNSVRFGFAGLGVGGALVGEGNLQALVEEGHLAQTLGERVVVELGGGEDALVGQEVDARAAALAGAGLAQLAGGSAATEVHLPGVAIAPDFDVELLAESVDAAYADAVKAAGDFVVGSVELAAGVELGEHHLNRRHPLAVGRIHHVDGNAAAVVDNGDGVVDVDGDVDLLGISGQRLVDGIVDHLIDQVVQAHLAGRANVHGGTQADCLKAFEDPDIFAGIAAVVAVSAIFAGRRRYFSRHRYPIAMGLQSGLPGGSDCEAIAASPAGTKGLKDVDFSRICLGQF